MRRKEEKDNQQAGAKEAGIHDLTSQFSETEGEMKGLQEDRNIGKGKMRHIDKKRGRTVNISSQITRRKWGEVGM